MTSPTSELRSLFLATADELAKAIPDVQQGSYSGYSTARIQAEAAAVAMLRFAAISLLPDDTPPRPQQPTRPRDAHGRFQPRS